MAVLVPVLKTSGQKAVSSSNTAGVTTGTISTAGNTGDALWVALAAGQEGNGGWSSSLVPTFSGGGLTFTQRAVSGFGNAMQTQISTAWGQPTTTGSFSHATPGSQATRSQILWIYRVPGAHPTTHFIRGLGTNLSEGNTQWTVNWPVVPGPDTTLITIFALRDVNNVNFRDLEQTHLDITHSYPSETFTARSAYRSSNSDPTFVLESPSLAGTNWSFSGIEIAAGTSPPEIHSITPDFCPPAGGSTHIITGAHFTSGSTVNSVTFGGTPATSFTVNSDTQITAVAPPKATGQVNVQVSKP